MSQETSSIKVSKMRSEQEVGEMLRAVNIALSSISEEDRRISDAKNNRFNNYCVERNMLEWVLGVRKIGALDDF